MKRIILSAVASLMLAAPLTAAPAMAQQYGSDRYSNDHRDNDRYDNNRHRGDWRESRRDARWDDKRYNGYWVGKSWHWGPPPASYYRRADFRLGWHDWRRGDRLGYFGARYVVVDDWRARHLKAPPRGYHYVRSSNGDIILAAIATGLIASIIASNG
jgi:Ni/Co efflux regulator RcnB